MSDNLMASTNVSDRLEGIEKRIDRQDNLLDGVNESLKELVRVSERQIAQAERSEERYTSIHKEITRTNERVDAVERRSAVNHDKLAQWAGMGIGISLSASVVIAVFTILMPLIRGVAS